MKYLKILLFTIILFFPATSAFAENQKTVLFLNPNFTSEFSERLHEALETSFEDNNVKIINYSVTDSNDENIALEIENIAKKNNCISIVSLGRESYDLIKKHSNKYFKDFPVYLFGIGPDTYKFPKNIHTNFIKFDYVKKIETVVRLHSATTVNIIIDEDLTKTKFFMYINEYIKNNPEINTKIIFADTYEKVVKQIEPKNSIVVMFSPLYDIDKGYKRKITPFGSVEKVARFTDVPIYGGFREYGTRFNIGAFNYSGLFFGYKLADKVLLDANIIETSIFESTLPGEKADFYINSDLNKYGFTDNALHSVENYSFKENITLSGEKKIDAFKGILFFFFIILICLFIKNRLVKRSYNERLKVDSLKTNFIANISHELRTPLNIIISSISLFDIYRANGEVQFNSENSLEKFNYLKKNSFRLLKLINNIIDTTRIDAGYFSLDRKTYNLVEVIEEVSLSTIAYAEKKNISIVFDTTFEEIYTLFDKDKIERVSLNLISNALKFTPKGGNLLISINIDNSNNAIISFTDTGLGISKADQKTIFDRFVQSNDSSLNKSEGSGIGLSLCKSIIEQHDGTITLESTLGVGSTFTISLPIINDLFKESHEFTNSRVNELTEIEFSDH